MPVINFNTSIKYIVKKTIAVYLILAILSFGNTETAKPVQVDVFYESLCPDSKAFIETQLWPTFKELYGTGIFNVSMHSYGNADSKNVGGVWKFTCQHGPKECYLNTVQTCATYLYPKPTTNIWFITCMMMKSSEAQAKACAEYLGLDVTRIFSCAKGNLGNQLEYVVGTKTPAHSFIPWIVVNGVGNDTLNKLAITNFKKLLCITYKGTKPKECLSN